MSKDTTTAPGVYHVVLKLKGEQRRVDLFHEILRRCDLSWPWKQGFYGRTQQCDKCEGLCFASPRINASDIKSAAKQASVKVTIVRFAPSTKCCPDTERYQRTRWIDVTDAHRLYRSAAWLETNAPRTAVPLLPAASPASDTRTKHVTTTHTIFPDGTCECACHDLRIDQRNGFTHHTGAGCCTNVWRARTLPK